MSRELTVQNKTSDTGQGECDGQFEYVGSAAAHEDMLFAF